MGQVTDVVGVRDAVRFVVARCVWRRVVFGLLGAARCCWLVVCGVFDTPVFGCVL